MTVMAAPGKVSDALAAMATTFEEQGYPVQAINCLQALVAQQLAPDGEVKARMHLARLLLRHTTNYKEALSHLLTAQLQSKQLLGNYCLKAEVINLLATCQQYLSNEGKRLEAYQQGLELWRAAHGSNERAAMARWVCRFYQAIAETHAHANQLAEAEQAAHNGACFAEESGQVDMQVALLLLRMQLCLALWNKVAVDEILAKLNKLVMQRKDESPAQKAAALGMDLHVLTYMQLHCSLLQVVYFLRLGKARAILQAGQQAVKQEVKQEEQQVGEQQVQPAGGAPPAQTPNVIESLLELLETIRASPQQGPLPYTWLSVACMEALVHLLAAHLLRAGTSFNLAMEHLEKGGEAVVQALEQAGVGPDTMQGALAQQDWPAAAQALALQLMLMECRAQMLIYQGQLAEARDIVASCQALLHNYPDLLQPLLGTVHLLTAQYAVSTAHYAEAVVHAQVAQGLAGGALQSGPLPVATAAVLQAEALLGLGGPDCVSRAIEALGPMFALASKSELAMALGYNELAACHVASGVCLAQQLEFPRAKETLSRALKVAYTKLDHVQMTCNVLLALVPGFLAQGDMNAADGSVGPASTLAEHTADAYMRAATQFRMAEVCKHKQDDEAGTQAARAQAALDTGTRRMGRLRTAVEQATSCINSHRYVLDWQLHV